ncbi:MAG: aldehyde dehydrogenase (NADP(+)) [Nocardioidaceae bacterium]
MDLHGLSLLGAEEIAAADRPTFHAVDPATGGELDPAYAECGPTEAERAAELAWSAYGALRSTTPQQRADLLEDLATGIEAAGEEIVERACAETGLAQPRLAGERARTSGQLRMFAADLRAGTWTEIRIDPGDPTRTPLPRPEVRQRSIPVGPVVVFAASNFPLAFSVAGGDTASALAAGCPVIVKAHPAHPGTSELVGRAIQASVRRLGLPEGTFSLLQGTTQDLGLALVREPRVRAVAFTGSRGGGLALMRAAGERPVPIPVYAEMSAVNPVFLLPSALAERADAIAAGYVTSLTGSGGQLCTKPGLVFAVDSPETTAFLDAAAQAVAEVPPATLLTERMRRGYQAGTERIAQTPGVEQLGHGVTGQEPQVDAQLFVTRAEVLREHPELADEVFGPAGLVVLASDADELLAATDDLEGQLTATIHLGAGDTEDTNDKELAANLLARLELVAGRVLFDGWPTGVEVNHAMVHGGPFPATTAPATTSVGARAIERFLRPVAYQQLPKELIPPELADDNPWHVVRRVDGRLSGTDT